MISVIIVNWNGRKWLKKCLDSLADQTNSNFEVIIVDNGSTDNSKEFIKKHYPSVCIIENGENLGFARGNNIGIEKAKGEFILLLNSDTWLDRNFLEKIKNKLMNNEFDVISPVEVGYDGRGLNYSASRTVDIFGHPYFKKGNNKTFYLQGICLFFKKNFYMETAGMDDNFFMYFEETDWFWRLNLLNKKFLSCPDIVVNHYGSGSVGSGLKPSNFLWRNQNTLQMLLKNYSWYNLLWVLLVYIVQNIFEIIFFLIILKPKIAYSYIEGWVFNVINIRKTLEKRKWVQENRLVSDLDIMKKMYFGFGKFAHLINFLDK